MNDGLLNVFLLIIVTHRENLILYFVRNNLFVFTIFVNSYICTRIFYQQINDEDRFQIVY